MYVYAYILLFIYFCTVANLDFCLSYHLFYCCEETPWPSSSYPIKESISQEAWLQFQRVCHPGRKHTGRGTGRGAESFTSWSRQQAGNHTLAPGNKVHSWHTCSNKAVAPNSFRAVHQHETKRANAWLWGAIFIQTTRVLHFFLSFSLETVISPLLPWLLVMEILGRNFWSASVISFLFFVFF